MEKMRLSTSSKFPEPPSDLVWIQTAFLGDVILNTGAFDLASRRFPGVKQHVVTTAVGASVLEGLDCIASTVTFDKRKIGFLAALKKVSRHLQENLSDSSRTVILQPHRSFRSSLLARFLGFPVATYFETNLGFFGRRVPRVGVFHEAVRSALPLELLGVSREDICGVKPRLGVRQSDPLIAWQTNVASIRRTAGSQLIAIAPGSQWGTKRWTPAGYAELAVKLLADSKSPATNVLIVGSPEEKELCDQIAGAIGSHPRLHNLAGKTSINDLRFLIPKLDLLVGNDSSPVQFASAFNVPTVAIFGATTPAMGFGPLASNSRVVEMKLSCRPCSDHGPMVCPLAHFKCMRDLTADRIFSVCIEVLSHRILR